MRRGCEATVFLHVRSSVMVQAWNGSTRGEEHGEVRPKQRVRRGTVTIAARRSEMPSHAAFLLNGSYGTVFLTHGLRGSRTTPS